MGKLTWTRYGLMLLAGLAGSACSQEAREPVEVGTVQVEMRSDLPLPEAPKVSTFPEKHPNQPVNQMPSTQSAVKRHEVPAIFREDFIGRGSSSREADADTLSWNLDKKPWVRAGKGFGVAVEEMNPPGSVHLNDAAYYIPTVDLNPYLGESEYLEPTTGSFKNRKSLVFHNGATGFAHEPPSNASHSGPSPGFETQQVLSPIPETQVYLSSKPRTQVTLAPSKNRLDLMNGNENLNRNRFYRGAAGSGLAAVK